MDAIIYCIVCSWKASLAVMTVTSAFGLGNCCLLTACMMLYCNHSNSSEAASPHHFPRNHFGTAAQSLALHSPSRQLVCMKIPSAGTVLKSLECLSLSADLVEDLHLSLSFCWWWPPVPSSAMDRVIAGMWFRGLTSEFGVYLEMFLNYVEEMEAINYRKYRHLQKKPDEANQPCFLVSANIHPHVGMSSKDEQLLCKKSYVDLANKLPVIPWSASDTKSDINSLFSPEILLFWQPWLIIPAFHTVCCDMSCTSGA